MTDKVRVTETEAPDGVIDRLEWSAGDYLGRRYLMARTNDAQYAERSRQQGYKYGVGDVAAISVTIGHKRDGALFGVDFHCYMEGTTREWSFRTPEEAVAHVCEEYCRVMARERKADDDRADRMVKRTVTAATVELFAWLAEGEHGILKPEGQRE